MIVVVQREVAVDISSSGKEYLPRSGIDCFLNGRCVIGHPIPCRAELLGCHSGDDRDCGLADPDQFAGGAAPGLLLARRVVLELTRGIGNLVDADMATESARLQSLQTKQQLGVQALGIANQAPQAVLSLFRG